MIERVRVPKWILPAGVAVGVTLISQLALGVSAAHVASSRAVRSSSQARSSSAGWRIQSAPNPPNQKLGGLYGVSCVSASACVAVGESDLGVLVEQWDGQQWQVQETPNPPDLSGLSGVSCVSASDCVAVGGIGFGFGLTQLVERWNGQQWQRQQAPTPGASALGGVSCVSASVCVTAGWTLELASGVLVERWDGRQWQRQQAPHQLPPPTFKGPVYSFGLSGVSCVSARDCVAVGNGVTKSGVLVERWDGRRWRVQYAPGPEHSKYPNESELSGVSCVSASDCVAVGSSGLSSESRVLVERWDGRRWQVQPAPKPKGSGLSDVSCVSASACVAVGSSRVSSETRVLVERWDGRRWEVQPAPKPKGSGLRGVSCVSASACVAVGNSGSGVLVEQWGG